VGAHSFRVPEGFLKPIAWCAELAAMATKVLALVTSYDETTANEEAMAGAAQQFDDLLQVQTNPTVALHCMPMGSTANHMVLKYNDLLWEFPANSMQWHTLFACHEGIGAAVYLLSSRWPNAYGHCSLAVCQGLAGLSCTCRSIPLVCIVTKQVNSKEEEA